MNKKKISIIVGVVLLVITAMGAIWGGKKLLDNRKVAEIKKLTEEAFKAEGEQRQQAWQVVREAGDNLSESQRNQLREQMGQQMMQQQMAKIDQFMALQTTKERNAYLDQEIQEMEQRRQQFEQMRREREANGDTQGGQRGGGPGGGGRGGFGGPGGGGPPGGGPGGGGPGGGPGGGGRGGNEWRQRIYDNTTPDQRAKYTAYREAVQRRRDELGLPEMRRGPR